jgi:predicted kinase
VGKEAGLGSIFVRSTENRSQPHPSYPKAVSLQNKMVWVYDQLAVHGFMPQANSRGIEMIIAMAGLPGTGKSILARALSAKLPALILDKDVLRAALFPADEIEYSTGQDDFVEDILLQLANYYLQKDPTRHIILDGRPFSKARQVDTLLNFGQAHAWDLRLISCTCSDQIVKARLDQDVAVGKHLAGNRDFGMYLRVKAQADPLKAPHLNVDTGEPFEVCVNRCLDYLGVRSNQIGE